MSAHQVSTSSVHSILPAHQEAKAKHYETLFATTVLSNSLRPHVNFELSSKHKNKNIKNLR